VIKLKSLSKEPLAQSLWRRMRALLDAQEVAISPWRDVLDGLARLNSARVLLSSLRDGSDSCLGNAVRYGAGNVARLGPGGLQLTAIGKQIVRLEWLGVSSSETVVLNVLVALKSHLENNFLLRLGADPSSGLRFGEQAITHISSASVIRHDNSKLFLLTWAVDSTYSSLFIDGQLKLRKRRADQGAIDSFAIELVGAESADTGGEIYGFELWEAASGRALDAFLGQSGEELTAGIAAQVSDRNLLAIATTLANFDGIDLASVQEGIIALLDDALDREHGYCDWMFDLVLAGLPQDAAAEWRKTRAHLIPQPIVSVTDLSVRFHRNPNLRFALSRLFSCGEDDFFDVLRDINFVVHPGEVLGIVGANGAGKSTLLRVLAGLIRIRKGEVALRSWPLLLSPGLGIREELSGRDNIYLACCFMGLSTRQTMNIYDEIVAFSELAEFIDQPFKFYSDGMKSRLVFSIATAVAPDLIMLDELLNAGDISFQRKAARRLDQLIARAKAVIVVTHSIHFVLHRCTKAILIDHGRQLAYGPPDTVVSRYLDLVQAGAGLSKAAFAASDETDDYSGFVPTVE
jgi:ABC-type polysaccharide/polyol phosphate transport system ATPase subunit